MIETVICTNRAFRVLRRRQRPGRKVGDLRATTWAASGHHLFGSGSKSSWCWTATLAGAFSCKGRDPAIGSNSS